MSLKQEYIDTLYEFQCCIATKAQELNSLDEIGNECYSDNFTNLAEVYLIFETLLCQDIENLECLTKQNILDMLAFLKTKCSNCCVDLRKFKTLLNI